MTDGAAEMMKIAITGLTLEWKFQPRPLIDDDLVERYADAMRDGATFPPVSVFKNSDGRLLVVDGFHRIHASKAAGASEIAAEITAGSEADALRFALSANATHGLPRDGQTLQRAYEIAVEHGLVDTFDSKGVKALLKCSTPAANNLTKEARQNRDRLVKSLVVNLHVLGFSQAKIAAKLKEHGVKVARRTVSSWLGNLATVGENASPSDEVTALRDELDEFLNGTISEIEKKARDEIQADYDKKLAEATAAAQKKFDADLEKLRKEATTHPNPDDLGQTSDEAEAEFAALGAEAVERSDRGLGRYWLPIKKAINAAAGLDLSKLQEMHDAELERGALTNLDQAAKNIAKLMKRSESDVR